MNEACGFRVGDRVQLLVDLTGKYVYNGEAREPNQYRNVALHKGVTGTVVVEYGYSVGVQWDVELNARLHNCEGYCPNGYWWYVLPQYVAPLLPIIDTAEFLSLLSLH